MGAPSGTSFNDTGLTPSTSYSYRVEAVDTASNAGPFSTVATASTQAAPPPTAPANLAPTVISSTQINLTWTASTSSIGVANYVVQRCTGASCSNFAQVGAPSGTSFNDTGLAPSTSYSYRVEAVDTASNAGPFSAVATASTQAAPPPTAPRTWPPAVISSTQINLTWTASTSSIGVANYVVQRCAGASCSNFAQVGAPSGTSFNDTGLTPSTSYSYRVEAVDTASNNGPFSTIATASTQAPPPPTAPTNVTPTVISSTQINLTWTASTSSIGIANYVVQRCAGASCSNFAQVGAPAGTSFDVHGLMPSTSYSYRVEAIDTASTAGPFSTAATTSTQAAPPPTAPTNLTPTVISSTRINLTWTASSSSIDVANYVVERCAGVSCSNFAQVATPGGTTFNDSGLTPNTSYSYEVQAVDTASNAGAFSTVATATTQPAPPPTAPGSLAAVPASLTQINLAWTASTSTIGVANYVVQRCTGANCTAFAQIATPTGTSYSDNTLSPGTSYSYQVEAIDSAGTASPFSAIATTSTGVVNGPPAFPLLVMLAVVRCAAIGFVGSAVTVGVAIALSPLMPIGLARTAEPGPGVAVDIPVLAVAVVSTTVLACLLALWPAWRVAKVASLSSSPGAEGILGGRSELADATARVGLPVTLTTGVRMALERGRGSTSVPVWSTIGGAVVGVGAVVISLTFGASLNHLLDSPKLFGVTWATEIWNNNGPDAVPAAEPIVRTDPEVVAAAFIQTGIDFRLDGRDLSGFAYTPVKGTFAASILTGRAPTAANEVALGVNTAKELHVHVGDTLRGNAENNRALPVAVKVVGTVVLPPGDASAHLGDGVLATRQALLRLAGGQARSPYVIAVAFHPGVDTAGARARLDRRLSAVDENFFTQSPATPTDLINFGRIQNLPLVLGAVLGVLALATVAHLLVTSIRRRRRDLAILKTIGFMPRRREPGRGVAGDDPGLDGAGCCRPPWTGARQDRLALLRRATRRGARRSDAARVDNACHTGDSGARESHRDRSCSDRRADSSCVGVARGVALDTPLLVGSGAVESRYAGLRREPWAQYPLGSVNVSPLLMIRSRNMKSDRGLDARSVRKVQCSNLNQLGQSVEVCLFKDNLGLLVKGQDVAHRNAHALARGWVSTPGSPMSGRHDHLHDHQAVKCLRYLPKLNLFVDPRSAINERLL